MDGEADQRYWGRKWWRKITNSQITWWIVFIILLTMAIFGIFVFTDLCGATNIHQGSFDLTPSYPVAAGGGAV